MRIPKYKAVIFDVDGTLVDSTQEHALSWTASFKANGYDVDEKKVEELIGMGGDKLIPILSDNKIKADSAEGKKISEDRDKTFRELYLSHIKALKGIPELLNKIKDLGLRLAIASSGSKKDLEELLENTGLKSFFELVVSMDDPEVLKSKPDPDIIKTAVQKLGLNFDEVIMVGDTPYDIQAAKQLGIPSIAFTRSGWAGYSLKEALAIYTGPVEMLRKFSFSPLMEQFLPISIETAHPQNKRSPV